VASYTQKAVQGVSIAFVFGFLAAITAYLTRIVLARKLQPEEYGLFYAVFTFIIFFLFFRDLGLGQALVKYISEFRAQQRYGQIKTAILSVFSMQMSSSIFFGIFFFFLANFLGEQYFKSSLASLILKLLVLYVLFSLFFIIPKQIFQGFQKMFLYSSVEFLKNFLVLILVVVFLKLKQGVLAPVIAFVFVGPLLFLIYSPALVGICRPIFKQKAEQFLGITKKLFFFGTPVLLTDIGGQVIGYVDTLMLTYFVSLSDVGIYNVILPSALIFSLFSKAIGAMLFPLSCELWVKKDTFRLSRGMTILHRYALLFVTPVILIVIYYAQFLVRALFGAEYAAGYPILQLLMVGMLFYVVASINTTIIVGIGRPKTVTLIIFLAALFNVLFNLLFIPRLGLRGAALATVGSYILMFILSTHHVSRYLRSPYHWKEWLTLFPLSLSFFGAVSLIEKLLNLPAVLEMIISAGGGLVAYGVLAYLFGLLKFKEIWRYSELALRKK